MKYNVYGKINEEYFLRSFQYRQGFYTLIDMSEEMESFNPDTYPLQKNNWDTYSMGNYTISMRNEYNLYSKLEVTIGTKCERVNFLKEIQVETPILISNTIKHNNREYPIVKIVYNSDNDVWEIYTNIITSKIEIDSVKQEEFFNKVELYNKRVEELNKEIIDSNTKKRKEAKIEKQEQREEENKKNKGWIEKLIKYFKR